MVASESNRSMIDGVGLLRWLMVGCYARRLRAVVDLRAIVLRLVLRSCGNAGETAIPIVLVGRQAPKSTEKRGGVETNRPDPNRTPTRSLAPGT